MIKALVIDDEPSAINTMQLMLERYIPEITSLQVTHANDVNSVIKLIGNFQPDVVFIDIQMPVINGFDLLKQLPAINFEVIFTTSHNEYAIQAIKFSALDYLLKPFDEEDLREALNKFESKKHKDDSRKQYENLLTNLKQQHHQQQRILPQPVRVFPLLICRGLLLRSPCAEP